LAGVPGLQLNDAEVVLERATRKVLNVNPNDIAVRYGDHNHEERHTAPAAHAQKLFLTEAPSKFDIQVRCQQSNQQCNLVQMELLQALRDRKTEFNQVLREERLVHLGREGRADVHMRHGHALREGQDCHRGSRACV